MRSGKVDGVDSGGATGRKGATPVPASFEYEFKVVLFHAQLQNLTSPFSVLFHRVSLCHGTQSSRTKECQKHFGRDLFLSANYASPLIPDDAAAGPTTLVRRQQVEWVTR